MGGSKTVVQSSSQQQATPTPEETRLNQLEIERVEATQPGQIETQKSGLNLINRLLAGETNLPGFFGQVGEGIGEDITSQIVRQSLKDIAPQFQAQGILDSGTAASIAGRTAADIRTGVAEYNLGNKVNLLNMALGGQAQVQQPLLAQSANLGSRLAGLRSISASGTQTTSGGMNPFLSAGLTAAGTAFGSPLGGALAGSLFGGSYGNKGMGTGVGGR